MAKTTKEEPSFQAVCIRPDCNFAGPVYKIHGPFIIGFITAYRQAVHDAFSHRTPGHLAATIHHTRYPSPFLKLPDILPKINNTS